MKKNKIHRKPIFYLPLIVFIIGLMTMLVFRQTSSGYERAADKRAVEIEAAGARRTIESRIVERVEALERMTRRWTNRPGGTPQLEWENDAREYIKYFEGFQAIQWVDQNFQARWVYPLAGNERAVNMNLTTDNRLREALELSREQRATTVSQNVALTQGGLGFLVYTPIFRGENFEGFIIGVFRTEPLLDKVLGEDITGRYSLVVSEGGKEIYRRGGAEPGQALVDPFWKMTGVVNLYNVKWQTKLTPKPETLAAFGSTISAATLIIGILFSFLLAAAAYLWQRARRQATGTARANERLESEIAARRAIEAEQSRLVAILEASADHIGMADANGKIIYTNRAGRLMVGLPETGELANRQIADLHPRWAGELIKTEAIPQALREGAWLGETAFLATDGREIPTSQMILAHKNETGAVEFFSTVARDISAQKQGELELKKSEKRYRDLTEKSLGFISTHDLEGRITSVNPAGAHALGYEPEEVVGRPISDFMPADKRPFMPAYFEQIRRERETTTLLPLLTKNGEERVWKCSNVLYDDDAENQYILGYAQDITELKRTERALQESRRMFERFMNNSPAVSYIKDADGKFFYASRHLSELFQVSLEEIYEKRDADFLPEEAAAEIRLKEKRILETGETEETLDSILMLDGKVHVWQSYKFLVEDGLNGKMVGGVSFDITERRRLEELLRETATLKRAILNSANYTVISTDAKGVIRTFNRTAEKWLGYRAEELVGRETPAIIHLPEEVARRAAELTEELGCQVEPGFEVFVAKTRTQTADENEWTYVRKDGTKFPVLLSITALSDDEGNITGYLGIGSDITERKQMESELKKARDAALDSARMKSEFLANMSHEIRTPMNGVLGMTELLLDTSLDKFQRESAETIRNSADGLLSIINDILDFSKIEAGKLSFETIDFDLRHTVESIAELFAEQAGRKKIEITSLVKNDVPIAVRGDPGRLRQILTNLVGNAVKFTSRGEVSLRVEKESETADLARLRFTVTDTGIGIKPEAQKYLFQAFTQADGSTTRKFGGTGLGLAISKQLIELMNGEIGFESEPGKGSDFSFSAEFKKQLSGAAAKPAPRADLKGVRVLIVDDNATNRKIMHYQTESWGMIAGEAESGAAALGLLKEAARSGSPYDLAILDLMMPEMDGFELARRVKSDVSTSDTRLIIMPSYGQRGHAQIALQTGISGYLIKPVKQIEFFECIAAVMSKPALHAALSENPSSPLVTRHSLGETRTAKTERILIAEDNPVNQTVAKMLLENLGYRSDVVENGLLALEAVENQDYSLILMDCQMPEMDGYAATVELRRSEANGRHIPVIALTANAMQGVREKCLAAGMDDYLTKPFKKDDLQQILERWLNPATVAAKDSASNDALDTSFAAE